VPAGIEKTADASVGSDPFEDFTITLSAPPPDGSVIRYSYTTNGIWNLGHLRLDPVEWQFRVDFADPSELGPGVYVDTVELAMCADQFCTALVEGTVSTFTITYTVTGQKPPPAEVVASTKSVAAEAMAYTDAKPIATIELSYLNVQPNASFTAEIVSSTYEGILGGVIERIDDTSDRLEIRFRPASTLPPGTYEDVITVNVCAKCPRHVVGSPLTIQARYTIADTADGPNGYTIQVIDQAATDLVWDAPSGALYLAVPSSADEHANSIVALDPTTGELGIERGVGDSPVALAVSDDGRYLYAATQESSEVQRFELPDLTPNLRIALPENGGMQLYPLTLAVAPAAPETLALVARESLAAAPAGVLIFDNETPRPNAYMFNPIEPRYRSLQWSGSQVLYAGKEGGDLGILSVHANGVALSEAHSLAQVGGGEYIRLDNGHLYLDSGDRVDPTTHTLVGSYVPPSGGLMRGFVTDSATGRAYGLIRHTFDHYLQSYDLNTYEPIATVPLHGIDASANASIKLIRWGDNGLALATLDGKVVLVRGPFVAP
jgi:hypothetical protein